MADRKSKAALRQILVSGAVELQKELVLTTNMELPSTFVFDYPTIAEMSAFIAAGLPAEVPMPSEKVENPAIAIAQDPLSVLDSTGRREYVEGQVRSVSSQLYIHCP